MALPPRGVSIGWTMAPMEQAAAQMPPPGASHEWAAISYQEKVIGLQMFVVFALALLLVYRVLAGQYESWWAPLSVLLAVPLALIGPGSCCRRLPAAGTPLRDRLREFPVPR